MTILDTTYECNRCGAKMGNKDRKFIILEVSEDYKEMVENVHNCPDCAMEVIRVACNRTMKKMGRSKK